MSAAGASILRSDRGFVVKCDLDAVSMGVAP